MIHKSSFEDVECITQQPTVVFVGRWPMTLAEVWKIVIWSRSSKRAVMMLSSEIDLNVRFSQRRMCVSYVFPMCFLLFPMCFLCVSYCFLCVSYVFHVLYFLRPVILLSLFWGLLCNSRCPPFTKLAIGYPKNEKHMQLHPEVHLLLHPISRSFTGLKRNMFWMFENIQVTPGEEIFGQWCFFPWWLSRQ